MLSFFPRGVLDESLNLIESVSEEFPSYSYIIYINNCLEDCSSETDGKKKVVEQKRYLFCYLFIHEC